MTNTIAFQGPSPRARTERGEYSLGDIRFRPRRYKTHVVRFRYVYAKIILLEVS